MLVQEDSDSSCFSFFFFVFLSQQDRLSGLLSASAQNPEGETTEELQDYYSLLRGIGGRAAISSNRVMSCLP